MNINKIIGVIIWTLVVAGISGGAVYFKLKNQNAQLSQEVQFVIDNPGYATKIYQAHQLYIKAAESQLDTELSNLSGGTSATPTEPSKK